MSMESEVIEDENHLINDCDLYAGLRNKLITRLNNAPESDLYPLINNELLKFHFHSLLSSYSSTHNDDYNVFNNHTTEAIVMRAHNKHNKLHLYVFVALWKQGVKT